MRRPFIIPVIVMCGGILAADCSSLPLAPLFSAAFASAGACLLHDQSRSYWLGFALFLFGWVNLATRTATVSPHDLRATLSEQHEFVELQGTLVGRPRELLTERNGIEFRHSVAIVRSTRIVRDQQTMSAHGLVVAHTPFWLGAGFHAGRHVSVIGVIGPPPPPAAEGLFDYRAHLARRGIHFSIDVESVKDWRLAKARAASLRRPTPDRFRDWAKTILARGLPEEDPVVRLLWAISLGWKAALTDEVAEPFMRSGAIHLFAVSGLHVAMISGIIVSLLRALSVPRAWCGIVAIPTLWFFCSVTGFHSSAVRATIMMSIVIAGWSLERPVDVMNSLAGAAFIILAWEPRQLFHAGFQLSFIVVFGIALMTPRFEAWRESWLQADPLLPSKLQPRWRQRLETPTRWISLGLGASLAAWLSSAPLIATYFHLFTPVSLLANLLIVPLAGPTLAACLASLACGDMLPAIGELFNHSAWLSMTLMCKLSEACSDLPGAWRNVAPPTPLASGLYYMMLTGLFNLRVIRGHRARAWAAAALVFGGCALAAAMIPTTTAKITVFALRGGGCVFIDAPGRSEDLLIDCGDEHNARSVVTPFLRSQGQNRLANVALTHGDTMHSGGYREISRAFPIQNLIYNPVPSRSPSYRKIIGNLSPNAHSGVNGATFGNWRILHPHENDGFPSGDDNAMVLLSEFQGLRALFLSDLGDEGQKTLYQRHPDLRADILIASLPARGTPLKNGLVSAVDPALIIVADAAGRTIGRAPPELRARLAALRTPVIYTSDSGAVTIEISKPGWRVRTTREAALRIRR